MPEPETVRLIDRDGTIRDVPVAAAGGLLEPGSGWRLPTQEDELGRVATQATEADYGGAGNAVKATALGLARGATLGLSDVAARAIGGEDTAYDLEQLKEQHAGLSIGGEIVGTLAPALLTAGASLPASLATRAGARVAERVGEGLIAKGVGAATEGAIYGLGTGVSELALDKDPLTIEHAASVLSSNALFGAGVGAGAGTLGYGIERGLQRAKGVLDSALERSAAKTQVATDSASAAHIPTAEQIQAAGEEITSTIPSSAIKDYGWYEPPGYGTDVVKAERGRAAIREGQRDPIRMTVDDQGRLLVEDGRHRLNAAIEADAPITVKWERGMGTGPDDVAKGRGLGRPPEADPLSLDGPGLSQAKKTELERIRNAQRPERQKFVDDLKEHYAGTEAEQTWGYTSKAPSKYVRGLGVESRAADVKVRLLLRNEEALLRDPGVALRAIEEQGQALRKIRVASGEEIDEFFQAFREAASTIRQEVLAGKIKGYKVGPGAMRPDSPLVDQAVEKEMIKRYGTADPRGNPTLPARLEAAYNVGNAETRVGDLYRAIKRLTAEPTSSRLDAIEAAKSVLGQPRESSLGERLLHAVPLVGGALGTIASTANKTLGGFRAVVGKAAERTGKAVSSFLGQAERGVAAASPYAPVLATKVLSSLRYAPEPDRKHAPPEPTGHGETTSLAKAFKARTDEIKSQTAYDATGVPKLRPAARQAMAARFDGIRPSDPILADRLESMAARRLEFLSSLIPRRPDLGGGVRVGPDNWQPSDMAMRSFARSAAALEDPDAVFERAAHGDIMPEDVAALRAVYPGKLEDFTTRVSMALPELRHTLPLARQTTLSVLTGIPVNPAMEPRILTALQAQYTYEPEPPRAEPQFGSVKADKVEPGTPAQQREAGTQ